MPHADTTSAPHDVLRECQRVLVPNGHLIIISFNALSIWGCMNWVRRLLPGRNGRVRGQGSRRLCDWLSLLGLPQLTPVFWPRFPQRERAGWSFDGSHRSMVGQSQLTFWRGPRHARQEAGIAISGQYLSRESAHTIDLDTLGKITRWCAGAERVSRAQSEPLEPTP